MKIVNLNVLVLLIFAGSATSCLSVKTYEKSYADEIKLGIEPGSKVFIIKKNGEKIEGRDISFSRVSNWKTVQKENWIAIDGQKVNKEDISGYQSQDGYYDFYKYNRTAEVQQYEFLPRVRQGKLNLYYQTETSSDGKKNYNVYYIKKEREKS